MHDRTPSTANASADPDLSGRTLGDYQLLRRLGRGGMAEVYLAEQVSLRRSVALKVLKSELATDETYVKRLHKEAQAAASLVHANIVQIHEVGCVEGIHYIAQEYIQGQNLRERLTRTGSLDTKLALRIMRGVASALCRAAENGIVHRDIKPENIMLARSGEVKVADFGLARVTHGDALNLTQVGITMGTPLYMSPEQVEGKGLDPRSDIYSLGVTCYHMLAGHPPFEGETALAVAVKHLKTQPARLENLREDLPTEVCRIVHRMLAKDPGHRYGSPRDLLRDLRKLAGGDEPWDEPALDAATDDTEEAGAGQATQHLDNLMKTSALARRRRTGWWWWPLGVAAAAALGAAISWGSRPAFLLEASASPAESVDVQDSVEAQYLLAEIVDTEAAWKAVIDNFPSRSYYVHRAERELALRYLMEGGREQEAREYFDRLAILGAIDVEFRAFGLAGQAVLLSLDQKYQESIDKLVELLPYYKDDLDRRMQGIVADVIRENDRALNRKTDPQWEELLQQQPPADSAAQAPGST